MDVRVGPKQGWTPKNLNSRTVVLEKTLESPLDSREIKPVNPKENQPWIFIGKSDAKAEAPILWPPNVKSWLIRKDPDARKDWRQEEKGETEDEMVRQHRRLNGHEFDQTPGERENREAWRAAVHGVAKSQTGLSDWIATTKSGLSPRLPPSLLGTRFSCFPIIHPSYIRGFLQLWLEEVRGWRKRGEGFDRHWRCEMVRWEALDGGNLRSERVCGYWGRDEETRLWVSSVQSLSHVWLFATPWTASHQPPSPSPSPRLCFKSCPLSRWCHPTISSSVAPFSCPHSFPASETFPVIHCLHQVAKILELQLQYQSSQWIFRVDFL